MPLLSPTPTPSLSTSFMLLSALRAAQSRQSLTPGSPRGGATGRGTGSLSSGTRPGGGWVPSWQPFSGYGGDLSKPRGDRGTRRSACWGTSSLRAHPSADNTPAREGGGREESDLGRLPGSAARVTLSWGQPWEGVCSGACGDGGWRLQHPLVWSHRGLLRPRGL